MRNYMLGTAAAVAVWFLPWHLALLAILVYVWAGAMVSTANTAKARATEQRVNSLVSAVAGTNQTLTTTTHTANTAQTAATSAQNTLASGNTGYANALGYGATSTANPAGVPTGGPNSTLYGLTTSDQTGGAASHTHTLPFYLPTATHGHDFDGHTHDFGGHEHPLT